MHYLIRKIFLGPGDIAHLVRYLEYNMQTEFDPQNTHEELGMVVHAYNLST